MQNYTGLDPDKHTPIFSVYFSSPSDEVCELFKGHYAT